MLNAVTQALLALCVFWVNLADNSAMLGSSRADSPVEGCSGVCGVWGLALGERGAWKGRRGKGGGKGRVNRSKSSSGECPAPDDISNAREEPSDVHLQREK